MKHLLLSLLIAPLLVVRSEVQVGQELPGAYKSALTFPEWQADLLQQGIPVTQDNFQFTYDQPLVDVTQVQSTPDGFQFKLLPNTGSGPLDAQQPFGTRVSSRDRYIAGKVCFKPTLPLLKNNGTIFAVYLRSFDKEPNECYKGDRWDEMDFEFMGRYPQSVWLNLFSKKWQNAGTTVEESCKDRGYVQPLPPLLDSYEFCLQWDARPNMGGYGIWFIHDQASDGYMTLRMDKDVLTEPMKLKMALWAKNDDWAGDVDVKEAVTAGVKDMRLWLLSN